jgi:ATP-dependent protease HslVU (ClpYQ) peptidase subunit
LTAILAVEDATGAWFGCDALFASDRVFDAMDRAKWTTHATHTIATSGAMRCGQIAEQFKATEKQERGEDDVAYVLRAIATPMRDAVKGDLYENEVASMGAVVAVNGRVYQITDDWGVYRPRCGYTAIGIGAPHVLAAFDALDGLGLTTEDRMLRALAATERHCTYVRGPFTVARVSPLTKRSR